jgi:hypothetical protein
MNILPIDELNVLETSLNARYADNKLTTDAIDTTIDEMLDLFLLAYASGVTAANNDLGTDNKPSTEDMERAVYAEVAGKTWQERVKDWTDSGGTPYDLARIAETDMTRIYNTAVLDTVRANGAENTTFKRWNTMMDDRVRDTHSPLQSVTVPYDADFYSWDGDHARAPGMFSKPENNINCRCTIELIKG